MLTRKRSLVQSQYRPPSISTAQEPSAEGFFRFRTGLLTFGVSG
jgi:hypothetical protein